MRECQEQAAQLRANGAEEEAQKGDAYAAHIEAGAVTKLQVYDSFELESLVAIKSARDRPEKDSNRSWACVWRLRQSDVVKMPLSLKLVAPVYELDLGSGLMFNSVAGMMSYGIRGMSPEFMAGRPYDWSGLMSYLDTPMVPEMNPSQFTHLCRCLTETHEMSMTKYRDRRDALAVLLAMSRTNIQFQRFSQSRHFIQLLDKSDSGTISVFELFEPLTKCISKVLSMRLSELQKEVKVEIVLKDRDPGANWMRELGYGTEQEVASHVACALLLLRRFVTIFSKFEEKEVKESRNFLHFTEVINNDLQYWFVE